GRNNGNPDAPAWLVNARTDFVNARFMPTEEQIIPASLLEDESGIQNVSLMRANFAPFVTWDGAQFMQQITRSFDFFREQELAFRDCVMRTLDGAIQMGLLQEKGVWNVHTFAAMISGAPGQSDQALKVIENTDDGYTMYLIQRRLRQGDNTLTTSQNKVVIHDDGSTHMVRIFNSHIGQGNTTFIASWFNEYTNDFRLISSDTIGGIPTMYYVNFFEQDGQTIGVIKSGDIGGQPGGRDGSQRNLFVQDDEDIVLVLGDGSPGSSPATFEIGTPTGEQVTKAETLFDEHRIELGENSYDISPENTNQATLNAIRAYIPALIYGLFSADLFN
ncbi:MAG: hypothetical protein FWC00_04570, partial [Firmicutes bacterium]|nr:hypothetical protein [Bacillota bacterium]